MKNSSKWCILLVLFLGAAIMTTWTPFGAYAQKKKDECVPLTFDDIRTMLDQMGYDFKDGKSKDKKTGEERLWGFEVSIAQRGWTHIVQVTKSGNNEWIYLTSWLRNPKEIPADKLREMLVSNDRIGPASFQIRDGWIRLTLPIYNRGISRRTFKATFDYITGDVESTESLWNSAKWKKAS